jgi:hypothetical protein
MFIIETPGSIDSIGRDILQFGPLRVNLTFSKEQNEFTISCNSGLSAKLEPFKSYMCCIRWDRGNFITCLDIYDYSHRDDIPVYRLRPEMYWFTFDNPKYSLVSDYDKELIVESPQPCQIHSYPVQMTNIKYYNIYLNDTDMMKEAIKYTTNHESCVFNDLARNILSGHGYTVK